MGHPTPDDRVDRVVMAKTILRVKFMRQRCRAVARIIFGGEGSETIEVSAVASFSPTLI